MHAWHECSALLLELREQPAHQSPIMCCSYYTVLQPSPRETTGYSATYMVKPGLPAFSVSRHARRIVPAKALHGRSANSVLRSSYSPRVRK